MAAEDASLDELIARAKKRGAEAEYTLGMRAYEGCGVPRDTVKARDLLGQAAGLGHERALEHVARMLGPGLPQLEGGDFFKGPRK